MWVPARCSPVPSPMTRPRWWRGRWPTNLVGQRLVTNQLTLTVGYDIDNLRDPECRKQYHGEVKVVRSGRQILKHAHGTAATPPPSSASQPRCWRLLTAS